LIQFFRTIIPVRNKPAINNCLLSLLSSLLQLPAVVLEEGWEDTRTVNNIQVNVWPERIIKSVVQVPG
jgi:hypothetical protein